MDRGSICPRSSGQSAISLQCRRQSLDNMVTSTHFASAAGFYEASRSTRPKHFMCCRSGTHAASRHGRQKNCSTSFAVRPGTGASRWAGCCDGGEEAGQLKARMTVGERACDLYSIAEHVLVRLGFCLPVDVLRWLERRASRCAIKRMNIPREWLLEGADGFRSRGRDRHRLRLCAPEPESDRVLFRGRTGRIGASPAADGRPRVHTCGAVLALLSTGCAL
jgi:hypothetical protein